MYGGGVKGLMSVVQKTTDLAHLALIKLPSIDKTFTIAFISRWDVIGILLLHKKFLLRGNTKERNGSYKEISVCEAVNLYTLESLQHIGRHSIVVERQSVEPLFV